MNQLALLFWMARREIARRLELTGLTGLVLLGLALFIMLVLSPRWQQATAEASLRKNLALGELDRVRLEQRPAPSTKDQLQRFTAWFPTIDQNAGDLRRVVEQAENQRAKIDLAKGEYQISSEPGAAFVKYEVVLPVKASYGTIRSFVAGVLNAVPHASLVELRLARQAASSKVLDARLHFVFIYRGG